MAFLTDEQVAQEIARLNQSEAVKLARLEQRIKYRKRQYLYTLRQLEKRGASLMADGHTKETLERMAEQAEHEEFCGEEI